jgi:hypothetical protein
MSDVPHARVAEHAGMASHPDFHRRATAEELRFLDLLVFWRNLYAERGPRDREPVQSVAATIREAERRMRSLQAGAPA